MLLEHGDTLPAGSVAVTDMAVVVLAVTVTVRANEPVVALAVAMFATEPVQLEVRNARTVELGSAEPSSSGVVLVRLGDGGLVPVTMGCGGGVPSTVISAPSRKLLFSSSSVTCSFRSTRAERKYFPSVATVLETTVTLVQNPA